MKTVEDFLNEINEKSWRSNIESEASRKFDQLIDQIIENKQEIVDDIIKDVKRIEDIKINEDNQIFNYSIFQEWLEYCTKTILSDKFREE